MNQECPIKLMFCYYGKNEFRDSGVICCEFYPESAIFKVVDNIGIGEKINFVLYNKDQVFIPSTSEKQTGIHRYAFKNGKFSEHKYFCTAYFYSYGVLKNSNYGYFSSFSSGADAIIDFEKQIEIDIVKHDNGKSHFINLLNDDRIYVIDNGLEKLYIYQDIQHKLIKKREVCFQNDSPRLMPLHPDQKIAYLLNQRTNQIVVIEVQNFNEIQRIDVPETNIDIDFCSGIAIDPTGEYVCVTIRFKNEVALFRINENGLLTHLDSISCGDMPRDILCEGNYVFITCTNSNRIEVLKIEGNKLVEIPSVLMVDQPITFANKVNI